MSRLFDCEAIRLAAYNAGKRDAVERFEECVKAEASLNIAGITHYVVTDHQLAVIARTILED